MRLQIIFIRNAACVLAVYCSSAHAQIVDRVDDSTARFFLSSEQCISCHSNMHSASGEDISIGYNWRASIMANSARDPYWHAGVRREVMDHPEAQAAIEDTCATCHMPMSRFEAAAAGEQGEVFAMLSAPLAMDGVSCTVCHQIRSDNLGEHSSFDGGFLIDETAPLGERTIFGPHAVDAGRQTVMQSAGRFVPGEAGHLRQSEVCATCHTLFTSALDEEGEVIGELPEQVPYLEWLNSDYRETSSCQSCHMPELAEDAAISSVLGQPRPNFSRHVFRGGNAFMLGILNKHRGELSVTALPQELDAEIARTKEFLRTETARLAIESVRIEGSILAVDVAVENLAGHKFPTAYPSRRAWLHLRVLDADDAVLFESGSLRDDGAIVGNDNDRDPTLFEPHYEEIVSASQVQIYEPIMVDRYDGVTTGLLSAVRYIKDNRLLPKGFDKSEVDADVAVHGAARQDENFTAGSDRIRYRIDIPGERSAALRVEVALRFQSIGRRWAENLRAYDAPEPQRFVAYYDASAAGSAMLIAEASMQVP